MDYHKNTTEIINLLKKNNYWFETFEHEPVRTSEEAAKIRTGYSLHQGTKAIVVRVKKSESDKKFVMLVFPADLRFDNDKVKALFEAKDIRLATEQEVFNLTDGVQVGGVPPFENEKIVFNAGDRRFSMAMKVVPITVESE